MDDPKTAYLECLAVLREDPLNAEALLTLATLYAEEGHRAPALWYLRKAEFLDGHQAAVHRLKSRLRNWGVPNGGPGKRSPPDTRDR